MAENPETDADASLVRAAREGDRRACEELFRRYSPWLRARLRQRCADVVLLDDVVQEVFVAVWTGAARGDDIRDVPGWLWRIGQRRLTDMQRRQGARHRLFGLLKRERPAAERSAEDAVLAGMPSAELTAALERLSPEHRQVIDASVLGGLTMEQIAARLGIPVGTVKTRVMRARRLLRDELS
ncbi:RNA polymerase sigma factor [Actinoplanes xinjiangensis]|jgi:RNA polymerase sigma-70 factor (ECF subfamily)|uniref:RNA polymerase sigma-70 factor (ECF subfamily) n=1 Tax=Actinoplanes xinjiangensis TaxID=512350 RepID=A0A316FR54_9ACTN|nr:sigma-70 family RNA polymerase sigma factor [Actinoplanes xinjiangensis]PWK50206.1 RNA polymerase sigma-70 factor (ECF subfamily) [Actinoplanes xinjiangensis]GIF36094.1 RNA polymerase sigma24 factor [Actinoplanes xinjiangensis]